jgi:hypothetical protein
MRRANQFSARHLNEYEFNLRLEKNPDRRVQEAIGLCARSSLI